VNPSAVEVGNPEVAQDTYKALAMHKCSAGAVIFEKVQS
jgi:hypothetical protein